MVQRSNKQTLSDANEQRITKLEQQLGQVLASNERLQGENEQLRKQNERLQKQVELLQSEVEELKRAGKRQAAPFARGHWVEHGQSTNHFPKRPGRKAGKGRFV
ncbi:MAG: hypothetical protein WCA79_17495 [Anaerolineales bacterium]